MIDPLLSAFRQSGNPSLGWPSSEAGLAADAKAPDQTLATMARAAAAGPRLADALAQTQRALGQDLERFLTMLGVPKDQADQRLKDFFGAVGPKTAQAATASPPPGTGAAAAAVAASSSQSLSLSVRDIHLEIDGTFNGHKVSVRFDDAQVALSATSQRSVALAAADGAGNAGVAFAAVGTSQEISLEQRGLQIQMDGGSADDIKALRQSLRQVFGAPDSQATPLVPGSNGFNGLAVLRPAADDGGDGSGAQRFLLSLTAPVRGTGASGIAV